MKQDIICSGAPDAEMLGAAVGEFLRTVHPDRQRLYDYYRGEQPVNKGEAVRGRPNNLLRAVPTLHHGGTHGILSRHPPCPRLRRGCGGRAIRGAEPRSRPAAPLL